MMPKLMAIWARLCTIRGTGPRPGEPWADARDSSARRPGARRCRQRAASARPGPRRPRALSSARSSASRELMEARNNLGNALMELGRSAPRPSKCYDLALEIEPDNAQIHCNLGNAQQAARPSRPSAGLEPARDRARSVLECRTQESGADARGARAARGGGRELPAGACARTARRRCAQQSAARCCSTYQIKSRLRRPLRRCPGARAQFAALRPIRARGVDTAYETVMPRRSRAAGPPSPPIPGRSRR